MPPETMPCRAPWALLPPGTPLLLYAALVPSAAVFLRGVWVMARRVDLPALVRSRGEASPGGLWRLLRLGVLHSRSIRSARGQLHACLLTGFLGLLAATTAVFVDTDLAGGGLLRGGLYRLHMAGANAAGLLLVAGCAGALWLHAGNPRRPADPRQRQLLLALWALLILGVSGFALQALKLAVRPEAGGEWRFAGWWIAGHLRPVLPPGAALELYASLWWVHALLAFGLIAWLPWGVMAHSLAAPANLLVASERPPAELSAPFDLRDLLERGEFDVRAGTRIAADLSPAMRLAALACTGCGRCDDVCPVASCSPLSPREVVRRVRSAVEATGGDEQLLGGGAVTPEMAWTCALCGACAQACPVLIQPSSYLVGVRRELVAEGGLPAGQRQALAALERSGSPYGGAPGERQAATADMGLPAPRGTCTVQCLYWLGCAAVHDPRVRSVVRATLRVLQASGVACDVLGAEERCCGDPARRMGEEGRFQQLALENIDALGRRGADTIITHCPHCLNTLRNEYPRFGFTGRVLHHTEAVAGLVREGRLPLGAADLGTVAFHDSCYAGRMNGVFDAPREVLAAAGARLAEMGRYWADDPDGSRPARLRLEEAAACGAEVLAVECPFCLKMLEGARATLPSDQRPRVLDVAEIAAFALDSAEATGGAQRGAPAPADWPAKAVGSAAPGRRRGA